MFIAALFTIAKTWKQPKCPLTDDWIRKMWYIYTMQQYSAIKKERHNAICSNMDGTKDFHTKLNKSERDKYHMISFIFWNLINSTNEPFHRKENPWTWRIDFLLPRGREWDGWGAWG